jgi:hypothetical protein
MHADDAAAVPILDNDDLGNVGGLAQASCQLAMGWK